MFAISLRKTVFCLLFLLAALPNRGQIQLKYHHLSTDDGLPSNYITNMVQDPQGFIWMATSDGLCRFDGYSFDVLRHSATGNDSLLLSNRLREVHQNPNGLLFIRLQGEHYSCYDTRRRCFVPFIPSGDNSKNYCNCVFTPDGATWLWYEYTGCIEVTYRDGVVESREYNVENGALRSNDVLFIEADSRQRVWIGTREGLYVKHEGRLRCVDSRHGFVGMAEMGGNVYFVTNDHQLLHHGSDGKLHTDITEFAGWTEGNSIRGVAPFNDRLIIVTNTTTYNYYPRQLFHLRRPRQHPLL